MSSITSVKRICKVCERELPLSEFETQYVIMARRYGESSIYETFGDDEIAEMLIMLCARCKSCQAKREEFLAIEDSKNSDDEEDDEATQ